MKVTYWDAADGKWTEGERDYLCVEEETGTIVKDIAKYERWLRENS